MPQTETTHKRTTRKYASFLAGFAVVCIGILLLSRAYRIDRSEYYPFAYLVLVAAAGAIVIRMALNDLRREGKLRGLFLAIAERGFAGALIQRFMRRKRPARGPLLRLSILAGVILLLVWVLAWNDLLFDQNLRLVEQCDWVGHERPDEATPIRQLYVMTQGRGTEERLNLMLRVTRNLVEAGASVVVFELPQSVSRPYYKDLVRQIQATGKVVFAVRNDYYLSQPLSWSKRDYYGPWTIPDTMVWNWGLITGEFGPIPRSHRALYYVPHDFVHSHQFESDTIPDVTIEILRRWRNYPREVKPVHAGRAVVFGDYRIPVSPSGMAISPARFVPPPGFLNSIAVDDGETGEFDYQWFENGVKRSAGDLKGFEQQIRGMIIIVPWSDPVENRILPFFDAGMYASTMILDDALHERFAAVRDDIHIPATIIVLLASVVLILRVRPLIAIPLLVMLGGLMLFGAAWLYWEKLIIVEVIYPLAGLGLCILLLPLAKISADIQEE
jgi:hypothetical protein